MHFQVVFVVVDFASCMWLMRKGQYFRPPALVCLTNFLGYLELVLEKTMPHGTAGGGPLAPEGLSERTQSSGEAEGCGVESVMLSNHLILCRPLLLLPSIFPSIRVFSNESVFLHQVAKVLEFH